MIRTKLSGGLKPTGNLFTNTKKLEMAGLGRESFG